MKLFAKFPMTGEKHKCGTWWELCQPLVLFYILRYYCRRNDETRIMKMNDLNLELKIKTDVVTWNGELVVKDSTKFIIFIVIDMSIFSKCKFKFWLNINRGVNILISAIFTT